MWKQSRMRPFTKNLFSRLQSLYGYQGHRECKTMITRFLPRDVNEKNRFINNKTTFLVERGLELNTLSKAVSLYSSLPPANEVWGKVIFLHLSVILFTGGVCLSACWDTPRDHAHPPNHAPPRTMHPSGPCTIPPTQHRACWEIRSTRGRHASYWNAILFVSASSIINDGVGSKWSQGATPYPKITSWTYPCPFNLFAR